MPPTMPPMVNPLILMPKIARELGHLIKRMWQANQTWGSPRIVLVLKMLGIDVAKFTVERYKPRTRRPSAPGCMSIRDPQLRSRD